MKTIHEVIQLFTEDLGGPYGTFCIEKQILTHSSRPMWVRYHGVILKDMYPFIRKLKNIIKNRRVVVLEKGNMPKGVTKFG